MDALQTMQNGFSGSGPSDINGGLTFGGGVQYGIMDNLAIGVEVGSLATSPVKWSYSYQALTGYDTTNPFNPTPIYSNASFSYETDFSAMEIGPVIRGYLPIGERLLLNGTLGLEYVALSGTTKYTSSLSPDQNTSFSGSTLGVKVTVGAEFFFSSLISVGVDLGYRMADITNVKDSDGNAWTKADGSSMSVDYSGLIMQGGIRLYF
jgi:opacity protein-like surface antigen